MRNVFRLSIPNIIAGAALSISVSVAVGGATGLAAPSGASQAPMGPPAPEPDTQGNLGHPYQLPAASRARMHECGVEWQALKMSGGAADKTWRAFAAVCLATPGAPAPPAQNLVKNGTAKDGAAKDQEPRRDQ